MTAGPVSATTAPAGEPDGEVVPNPTEDVAADAGVPAIPLKISGNRPTKTTSPTTKSPEMRLKRNERTRIELAPLKVGLNNSEADHRANSMPAG
jgi:hypothetical protein